MTKNLNQLFEDYAYVGYKIPKWSSNINHLAYDDDTIIFLSFNYFYEENNGGFKEYGKESGQKINKEKIFSTYIRTFKLRLFSRWSGL